MLKEQTNLIPSATDKSADKALKQFKTIKAKAVANSSYGQKATEWIVARLGSNIFLGLNAIWFLLWILINTGVVKWIEPFDPFPFSLLTTTVSLEAIILAILVLISQNTSLKIGDLREEVHLQVNLMAEKENTKMMKMLLLLLKKNGMNVSSDPELKELLKPVDEDKIKSELEKEI